LVFIQKVIGMEQRKRILRKVFFIGEKQEVRIGILTI
jgi:hypothetical protein